MGASRSDHRATSLGSVWCVVPPGTDHVVRRSTRLPFERHIVEAALASLTLATVTLATSLANASPAYHPRASEPGVLPPAWETLACTNCHVSTLGGLECGSYPCFNPFGYQYWSHDRGWAAVSRLDADGDGRTNEREIFVDRTLPGFPEAATDVGCDMTTCALDGSEDCGAGVRCESAHAWHGSATHFAFWFSCASGRAGTLAEGAPDWSRACADVDECVAAPCGAGVCSDTPLGSWTWPGYTCACDAGSGLDGVTCVTAGECTDGSAGCALETECVDPSIALGDALCECRAGTSGDGHASGTGCVDIDECAGSPCANGICHASSLDAWSAPGYDCACHAGFAWDGLACALVDECLAQADECTLLATCGDPSPAAGDYVCTCAPGSVGDGRWSGSGCMPATVDASVYDAARPADAAVVDADGPRDAGVRDVGAYDTGARDVGARDGATLDASAEPLPSASSCACRVGGAASPRGVAALLSVVGLLMLSLRRGFFRPTSRGTSRRPRA